MRAEREGGDTGERGGEVERNGLAKEVGEEESIFCCENDVVCVVLIDFSLLWFERGKETERFIYRGRCD